MTGGSKEATITPKGPGRYEGKPKPCDAWIVEVDFNGTITYYLDKKTRGLISAVMPEGKVTLVPRGAGGERIVLEEEKPAETWQQAFLKFGFGYHMARRNLLAAAFHWDTMYEYETKASKSWPASKPVEEFRDAWIQEFVNQSKNRTRFATQRLLSMTLGRWWYRRWR